MEEKLCTRCKEIRPSDRFYEHVKVGPKGQKWRYLDSHCKDCRLKYQSERRRQVKRQAVEYLGGACKHCGLATDRMEVYDFHHVDPEQKDFIISQGVKCFEKIKTELDKCILLCANCHRLVHGYEL